MEERWYNLVAETQFATDLVISGIRQICELPMDDDRIVASMTYSETYPLNVGLLMYTTGLERLCKLALACEHFVRTQTFPSVRAYSHKLSDLTSALEELDLRPYYPFRAIDGPVPKYARCPADEWSRPSDGDGDGTDLIRWLEYYAAGNGRYEILDSLSDASTKQRTWATWEELCARGSAPAWVNNVIGLRAGLGEALTDLYVTNGLELSTDEILKRATRPLSRRSSAVGLAMYRRARRAAVILGAVTGTNRHIELPYLREVVTPLSLPSRDFFTYVVAEMSELEIVEDELSAYFAGTSRRS